MSDPSARSQVRASASILRSAHHLNKRREELHRAARERRLGPQGEQRSETIAQAVEMISLDKIRPDPTFDNVRLSANEEEMVLLVESMSREGLKVPITLVPAPVGSWYHVRAGFRRTTAARRLHWLKIPAIVLPDNLPVVDEYWTNIIENSARSKLSTYEIACAARTMRDKFGVTPREFALRAGYSDTYVANLVRCITRLPDEIVSVWKDSAPIPVDLYVKWSQLQPTEAVREMLTYSGRNPKVVKDWKPPPEIREKAHPAKMASVAGLTRMQRLRFAAEAARELSDRERTICLHVIDFCSGARDDVPEFYERNKKQEEGRADLPPPEDIGDAASLATSIPPKAD